MVVAEFDLVVRGRECVDGTGAKPRQADIAIREGSIALLEAVRGAGAEEIDARGMIVTPGFVDVQTHYDGQSAGRKGSSHHRATAYYRARLCDGRARRHGGRE